MRGGLSITSLLAVFLVVAGGCGKGEPAASPDQTDGGDSAKPKPAESVESASNQAAQPKRANANTHSTTAKQFFDEYKRDDKALATTYKDTMIEISGEAIMVSSAHGVPFIKLGVGIDELTGAHCFTQVKQPWSVVVPGQQVKLRGKLPERLFGAQLQDCEIVAAGPSPAIEAAAELLTAELAADPNGTNAKYKDAHFFIEGTVDEIDNELGGVVYLKGNGKVRVRCAFDLFGEQKQVPSLKLGDRVHVAGQYAHLGVDDEVELQLCLLYDPQHVKPVTALTSETSDRTPVSFVPRDAIATVVIHPKRGSVVDFVVDPKGDAFWDSTKLSGAIERSAGSAAAKFDLADTLPKPAARNEETTTLTGTAVYFPDDQTLVRTDEQRLRSLISGSPAQTPLTKKLSQLDLNHDLVAVVAIEGYHDQLAGLLKSLAEQSGSAELGGLSVLPRHANFAVATLDLSGDTLLNVTVEAPNEQSAGEVEGGFDLLLDAAESLRNVVPKESPLLGLVQQIVKGTTLQTSGSQVVLKTQMPAGLLDFLSKDAEAVIAGLAEMTAPHSHGTPRHDGDSPSDSGTFAPYALPSSVLPDSDRTPIVEKPKLPVPDQAARDKALQLVRELYEKEFRTAKTAAEKTALAESMIARAAEVEAAAERYVLLDVARKMAAVAGGVDAALNAVAQLDDFEVDTLQLASESLVELSKETLTPENRLRVANEMLDAARLAAEIDRYEFAVGLLQQAAASARTARDLKLAKTATDRLDETTQLKSRYEEINPALETLKANPDDAAANQAAGEFYCLMQGQWETGLPFLVKGNDPKYKLPSEKDLAGPKTTGEQTTLADRWLELAGAAKGLTEKHLQLRAAYWYRRALPNLTGLEKETVEKRLSEMKHVAEAAGPKVVFLPEVPMLGVEGVLINDDKGHFREERLKGEKYPQVLWAHPQDKVPSHYAFTLNRKYSKLTGKAAINDVQSVVRAQKPQLFAIYGDKRLLWKSRPLQNKLDADEFSVNVSNVGTLHLYVAGGGYGGHALWVDVVLEEKQ